MMENKNKQQQCSHTSLKYFKLTTVPSENKNETKSELYVAHSSEINMTRTNSTCKINK
jgi:hypothetical protein